MDPNTIHVVVINTNDKRGGAAIAASRIHYAIIKQKVKSTFIVKQKYSSDTSTFEYFNLLTKKSFLRGLYYQVEFKLSNIIRKYKWKDVSIKNKAVFSDLGFHPIYKILKTLKYDIIHLQWISGNYIDLAELKKINKPIVWTMHDAFAFTGGCHIFDDCTKYELSCGTCPKIENNGPHDISKEIWKEKQREYSNWSLHVVATSQWMASAARRSSLFRNFPIHVIPNPIDTTVFKPFDKQVASKILNLDGSKKYILFGAMKATSDPNKGFQLLKEALMSMNRHEYPDLELLIFGHNTDQSEIGNLGFPVHFFGHLDGDISLACMYNASDVTVVPSVSENLPNLVMESMACATPSVAFRVGGNVDMISHKQNGYLAEPYDTKDLAKGILWCIEHNKDGKLSGNARQKVMESYTEEIIGIHYKNLYQNILSEKSKE